VRAPRAGIEFFGVSQVLTKGFSDVIRLSDENWFARSA
jgi:hypothetical protein